MCGDEWEWCEFLFPLPALFFIIIKPLSPSPPHLFLINHIICSKRFSKPETLRKRAFPTTENKPGTRAAVWFFFPPKPQSPKSFIVFLTRKPERFNTKPMVFPTPKPKFGAGPFSAPSLGTGVDILWVCVCVCMRAIAVLAGGCHRRSDGAHPTAVVGPGHLPLCTCPLFLIIMAV